MATATAQLANAAKMMTRAEAGSEGITVFFADGRSGLIPWSELPEVAAQSNLRHLDLPNAHVLTLRLKRAEPVDIPWDFARHFCDPAYRPRVERVAQEGRETLGKRIRALRERARLTQAQLASRAGIGRITLVRVEGGQRSPRYETLSAIAEALGTQMADVLPGPETSYSHGRAL